MNNKLLLEGLDFHDMEGQMIPIVSVDEYVAKMGSNSEIITLSFIVKSEAAGQDLVDWFERGYDFVLDASLSEGELETNRWLVFVEISRRSKAVARIIELLSDLKTLTNLKLTDWTVNIDDEEYDPDEHVLKQVIICNPNEYKIKKEKEEDLNEMRTIAGLSTTPVHPAKDDELQQFINIARI